MLGILLRSRSWQGLGEMSSDAGCGLFSGPKVRQGREDWGSCPLDCDVARVRRQRPQGLGETSSDAGGALVSGSRGKGRTGGDELSGCTETKSRGTARTGGDELSAAARVALQPV